MRIHGTERSAQELSSSLLQLGVSHSIRLRSSGARRLKVIDSGNVSKVWVHIGDRIDEADPRCVNFITACFSELALTDMPILREPLTRGIREALRDKSRRAVRVRTMNVLDYVNLIAKPSILNKIQTLVYKIQPYERRKIINSMIISWFNSGTSTRQLRAELERGLQTQRIIPLLAESETLRLGVSMLKTHTPEEVQEKLGTATFDLLYLSKVRR